MIEYKWLEEGPLYTIDCRYCSLKEMEHEACRDTCDDVKAYIKPFLSLPVETLGKKSRAENGIGKHQELTDDEWKKVKREKHHYVGCVWSVKNKLTISRNQMLAYCPLTLTRISPLDLS